MKIENITFRDGEYSYNMPQSILYQIYSTNFQNPSDIVRYVREICKQFGVQAFLFVLSRNIYVTENHFIVTYVGTF